MTWLSLIGEKPCQENAFIQRENIDEESVWITNVIDLTPDANTPAIARSTRAVYDVNEATVVGRIT